MGSLGTEVCFLEAASVPNHGGISEFLQTIEELVRREGGTEIHTHTQRETERQRDRDRETGRDRERHTQRETERVRERDTRIHTEKNAARES